MLKKLTIDGLRGATRRFDLPFDTSKRITIVYGENGTGKSTVCDGLEFVTNGTVSSLAPRGLGVGVAKYWTSTGRDAKDIKVTLDTKNGSWSATMGKGAAVVTPTAGKPSIELLRRHQILNLVCAKPADRFAVVRPFIDIDAIEASEGSLRELVRDEKDRRKEAVARVDENSRAIENFWKQAGSPPLGALDWAKKEAARDISDLDKELETLGKVERTIKEIELVKSRWIEAKQAIEEARKKEKTDADTLKSAKSAVKDGAAQNVDLLQAAAELFHEHRDPETCPLCLSNERVNGLAKAVDDRLAAISGVSKAATAHKTSKAALERTEALEVSEREKLKSTVHRFCKAFNAVEGWPEDVRPTEALIKTSTAVGAYLKASDLPDGDIESTCSLIIAWLAPVTKAVEFRHGQKAVHDQLKKAVKTYQENYDAQKALDLLIPQYEKVLEAVADERKGFVGDILEQIAQRVGELYELVHPNEGLSKIALELDPKQKSSLQIGATFPGVGEAPPQAVFSDSHLDTLGLCMFLALAERDDPKNKILVLDDVLGSVDEPHVDRLINMLYAEAERFQHCLVTTHYKPWRELYRWGYLRDGECHFVELVNWSHANGIQYGYSIPPIQRLRELLAVNPPDPQEVCAKAGVVLEAILDFLTQLYECAVPRRRGKPALGDLINSLNSKLKKGMVVERLEKDPSSGADVYLAKELGPIIDHLVKVAGARNVFGCHFNELAHHLHDQVAIDFSTHVLELADALIDPDAGWPRSKKSGDHWSNSKKTRKLRPLLQPE